MSCRGTATFWAGCLGRLPGTAPKAYRLLAQIMKAAAQDGAIVRSPVAVKGAAKEEHERAVATVAEVGALSEAVPERHKAMVLLAAWCALRFGELAALRRDRIDLLHGGIRVAETLTELATGERFAGPPKTAGAPSLSRLTCCLSSKIICARLVHPQSERHRKRCSMAKDRSDRRVGVRQVHSVRRT